MASQKDGRLDAQLQRLAAELDYQGRILIVEATHSEWRNDEKPSDFPELEGVRSTLRKLQAGLYTCNYVCALYNYIHVVLYYGILLLVIEHNVLNHLFCEGFQWRT